MERIPELDLMDNPEQARAYADADFSEPHDAFVDAFSSRFPDFTSGTVLDLGCGTADVMIRFAKRYPLAQITGVDGSQAMLDIALQDIERNGLDGRILLKKSFLPDPGLAGRTYDAVMSNSLLHHLQNPLVLWKIINECAKIGAPLFIMDLMRPESRDAARNLMLKYAADESPLLQRDFYNSLLASYNREEVHHQLRRTHLEYLTIESVSDRHLLVWGRMDSSSRQ